ncbi:MAG TPA: NAD-dependent malic enzyme [Euzebyales bacterium]|nr:NAD-dependent malic enzyme [Euzebyales bacterium]
MFEIAPSAGYTQTLRCELQQRPGTLGRLTSAIGAAGGDLEALEIVGHRKGIIVRDISVMARDEEHAARIADAARAVEGVSVLGVTDRIFEQHRGGKLSIRSRIRVRTRADLSMAYTPGVGRVSRAIAEDGERVWDYTIRGNTVAVLTDGSAVLGLGDIGPEAALPVMEGKAILFKEFADVDAFPICVRADSAAELIAVGRAIAPTFGGINLEDIAAPRCFEVERTLKELVDIPVFHDDQHGTAVVVLAAMRNAARAVGKRFEDLRIVMLGMGAAGVACVKLLNHAGVADIIGCDRRGIIHPGRDDLDEVKRDIAERTNARHRTGDTAAAFAGADAFIGLSGPDTVDPAWVAEMAPDAIVFALANPVPEVMPEQLPDNVSVVATGRSDYPNQINNVLVFPGIFRGLLDARATDVDLDTEEAAARALAGLVDDEALAPDYIIPSPFDEQVVPAVAAAVRSQVEAAGDARVEEGADGAAR